MASTFEQDHSIMQIERVVTCQCGWVGPLDKYEKHEMEAFSNEISALIRNVMKGAHNGE